LGGMEGGRERGLHALALCHGQCRYCPTKPPNIYSNVEFAEPKVSGHMDQLTSHSYLTREVISEVYIYCLLDFV